MKVHKAMPLLFGAAASGTWLRANEEMADPHFLTDDALNLAEKSCSYSMDRWQDESNSDDTFAAALEAGERWRDPLFTADRSSLYWSAYPTEEPDVVKLDRVNAWKTPAQIDTARDPSFFGNYGEARPQGIKQNQIGDCWFIAAAAALAEVPERLDGNIGEANRDSDYNSAGIFRFQFWVKGQLVGINIDDRLPVEDYYGTYYAYGSQKSDAHAWWMPLFEKAFAKFNQNYDRIQGGSGHESLRQLTNKPVFRFDHELEERDLDQAWETFHTLASKNYPAVTGCCRTNPPDGLVPAHAYTLLGTAELTEGSRTHRLARLRNPWSTELYEGPWSDSSSEWTADLKRQAGWSDADDGAFFMPFDSFIQNFYSTNVAIYEEFGQELWWSIRQTEEQKYMEITNPVRQKLFITVETLSARLKPHGCEPEQWLNLYLYDRRNNLLNEDRVGFIGGLMFHDSIGDVLYTETLAAGTYTLIVANWNLAQVPTVDYIVQVYQESADEIVTLDGEVGAETSDEAIEAGLSLPRDSNEFDPESPGPADAGEQERLQYDDWLPDLDLPDINWNEVTYGLIGGAVTTSATRAIVAYLALASSLY